MNQLISPIQYQSLPTDRPCQPSQTQPSQTQSSQTQPSQTQPSQTQPSQFSQTDRFQYQSLPTDRQVPSTFQEFNIVTLEAAVWKVIQKMAHSGRLPVQYMNPYCKSCDFMVRDIWLHVFQVTFTPGKKLKPVFISKMEVCKMLSPSSNRVRGGGSRGGNGEGSFEPGVQKYSPRIGSMSYWSRGELRPWTWYISYPGTPEGKKKAADMIALLHQKELAWTAIVRPSKRVYNPTQSNQSNRSSQSNPTQSNQSNRSSQSSQPNPTNPIDPVSPIQPNPIDPVSPVNPIERRK